MKYVNTYVLSVIVGVGIIAYMFFLSASTSRLNRIANDNNAYVRTMVCIASVSPTQRTAEYVQSCYDKADAVNGTHITRYGNGK